MGAKRYCKYCGNPGRRGQGICRQCEKRPKAENVARKANWDAIGCMYGFLKQPHISSKNIETMKSFLTLPNPKTRDMAEILIKAAELHPGRRRRWLKLAQTHRDLLERMLANAYFDAFIDEASVNGAWPDLYPEEELENPLGDDDDKEETVEP